MLQRMPIRSSSRLTFKAIDVSIKWQSLLEVCLIASEMTNKLYFSEMELYQKNKKNEKKNIIFN